MEISLSDLDWKLKGYWPWVPIKDKSMETGQELQGVTPWIDATVPGGVHYDLYQAGIIENPYVGLNSLHCEWVENRWWMYKATFDKPRQTSKKISLLCKGLDYEVFIYINGICVGQHKGLYEVKNIDIADLLKEHNEIIIIFMGIPQEMGQIGYTSKTSTQKSRFNYKWDFSTRLVHIGFWKDVVLKLHDDVEITDLYIQTDTVDNQGIINISCNLFQVSSSIDTVDVAINITSPQGNEIIVNTHTVSISQGVHIPITINNPELWYPNGSGNQPLYTLYIALMHKNKEIHAQSRKIGIRKLDYTYNDNSHADALPYTFVINHKKIYIKGVNITPLDHMYGNVTKEQYEFLVESMVRAHVNMVRVWGGGLIEKEWLYDLCDERGILIWQEFIQSSSGIDNKPCEDKEFLSLLERNSRAAILDKRNHVSLAVWSGGNELMDSDNTPTTYKNKNITILQKLVKNHDPQRMFLPTSASGPVEFITEEKGVSHDVHGSWQYRGNPEHYVLYGESDNLFHSEFGMDGTTNIKSLKKFLPESAWYPTPMSKNIYWEHHGAWWGTYYRDTTFFGEIEDLKLFTQCSQYMQAEGLRFIVEANRRRKFQNSGSIIWQLQEPWPNASCTNLIDYYGETKPAYYWVQQSYANKHISLTYSKLDYGTGETFQEQIWIHNTDSECTGNVIYRVRDIFGTVLKKQTISVSVANNSSQHIGDAIFLLQDLEDLFLVELELCIAGNVVAKNTYMFSLLEEQIFKPLLRTKPKIETVQESTHCEQNGVISKHITIKNMGSCVSVLTGVELIESDYWMLANQNYITLFPEEQTEIVATLFPKKCGGLLSSENHQKRGPGPTLRVSCLNN